MSFNGLSEWIWTDPEILRFLRFSTSLDGGLLCNVLLKFVDSPVFLCDLLFKVVNPLVFLGHFCFEVVDAFILSVNLGMKRCEVSPECGDGVQNLSVR